MKLTYKAYALDDFHYMDDSEVRIYPSGKIEYNNGTPEVPIWEEYRGKADWISVEEAILTDKENHLHDNEN